MKKGKYQAEAQQTRNPVVIVLLVVVVLLLAVVIVLTEHARHLQKRLAHRV